MAVLNCRSSASTSCFSYITFQYLPTGADDAKKPVGQPIGAIGEAALREEKVESPTPVYDVSEQDIQQRLASVKIGVWLSVIVSLGGAIYALLTWDGPNRGLILALVTGGLLTAPLISWLPTERIIRSRWREAFFFSWSAADVLLIAVCAALD